MMKLSLVLLSATSPAAFQVSLTAARAVSSPAAVARAPRVALSGDLIPPDGGSDLSLYAPIAAMAAFALGLTLAGGKPEEVDGKPETKTTGFGWLQADLRMPLPAWAELQEQCFLVGTWHGQSMYLCATAGGEGFSDCQVSNDFSKYYGKEVYVCAGKQLDWKKDEYEF